MRCRRRLSDHNLSLSGSSPSIPGSAPDEIRHPVPTVLYSTRRLVDRANGATACVLDPLRCYGLPTTASGCALLKAGISGYDVNDPASAHGDSLRMLCAPVQLMARRRPAMRRSRARRQVARCRQLLAAGGYRPAGHRVRRQPGRHRRPASLLGPLPHVIKLSKGNPGRRGDAHREAVGLRGAVETCAGCTPTSWCREFIVEARGANLLFRGRRLRGGRDAPAGPEGRVPPNLHRGEPLLAGAHHLRRGGDLPARVLGQASPASTCCAASGRWLVLEVTSPGLGASRPTGVDVASHRVARGRAGAVAGSGDRTPI